MLCKLKSYQLISALLYKCVAFGNLCNEFYAIRWLAGEVPLSLPSPLFLGQRKWARKNFLAAADWERIVLQLSFFLSVLALFPTLTFLLTCRSCLGKAVFPRPLCSCQLHFLFDICTMMQAVRENNLHKPPTWGTGRTEVFWCQLLYLILIQIN